MTGVWRDAAAGLRADLNLKILLSHCIYHYLALACIFQDGS